MARHSFIQMTKLTNVIGRIGYISSEERQEFLYETYETADPEYWEQLAAESQMDHEIYASFGKCIEARELIISLPEEYVKY